MLRVVCFDLFGTLLQERPDTPYYNRLAAELQVPPERFLPAYKARRRDTGLGNIKDMYERVFLSLIDIGVEIAVERVHAIVRDVLPLYYQSIELMPMAHQLLSQCKSIGLKLALISNAGSYAGELIDRFNLRQYFDVVSWSFELHLLKPDAEIYLRTIKALNEEVTDCLFVGDGGDHEFSGAKAVGMTTLKVHSFFDGRDSDFQIPDLAQASAFILRFARTN